MIVFLTNYNATEFCAVTAVNLEDFQTPPGFVAFLKALTIFDGVGGDFIGMGYYNILHNHLEDKKPLYFYKNTERDNQFLEGVVDGSIKVIKFPESFSTVENILKIAKGELTLDVDYDWDSVWFEESFSE